jgi:hypothetical protein
MSFPEPNSWQTTVSRLQCQTPCPLLPLSPASHSWMPLPPYQQPQQAISLRRIMHFGLSQCQWQVQDPFWNDYKIETFNLSASSWAILVHNQAFGASNGINSNIISSAKITSHIGLPFICLFPRPLPLNSSFRSLFYYPWSIPTHPHDFFCLLLCQWCWCHPPTPLGKPHCRPLFKKLWGMKSCWYDPANNLLTPL